MNHNKLLLESHNFNNGDSVIVFERKMPNIVYDGTIYSIINKPVNKYTPNLCVDYFYITFDKEIYAKLILRGSEIMYKNKPAIVGTKTIHPHTGLIETITLQYPFIMEEISVDPNDIQGILIWRVGFNIVSK
jgi:hypothetical protein